MADLEGKSLVWLELTQTVGKNMQMHARWMCPLLSAAADHLCPGMKVPLSGERYQQQHPTEAIRTQKSYWLQQKGFLQMDCRAYPSSTWLEQSCTQLYKATVRTQRKNTEHIWMRAEEFTSMCHQEALPSEDRVAVK